MLAFKPKPFGPTDAPRWDIGVDRKHVAVYVAVTLVAGFAVGFMIARAIGPKETPPVVQASSAAVTPPTTVRPAAALETPPTDFHKVTRLLRADTLDVEGIGPVRMIGIE